LNAQTSLQFGVRRELFNFYWDGFLTYRFERNIGKIFLYERFSEMIIKTDRKFIRDDNEFRFIFFRRFSSWFNSAVVLNSISFADDKLGGLNRASSSELMTGGRFDFFKNFSITTVAGYKIDYQMGQKDDGWSYKLSVDTSNFEISNYNLRTSLTHSEDFIKPRKNITTDLNLTLWRKFTPDVESKVEFFIKRLKRDFYFFADSTLKATYGVNYNIEGRDEKLFSGQINFVYPISKQFMINLNFSANSRNIFKAVRYKTMSLYDVSIDEFILKSLAGISYELSRLKFKFSFDYAERNETHSPKRHELMTEGGFLRSKQNEERKNNYALRRGLSGEVSYDVSYRIKIGGIFSVSLFRYDTPSSLNDDDRDELLQLFRIFAIVKLSKEITVELPLDLNNQHLVYIFATRSANNNWNRVIRFSPSVMFEMGKIRNRANFSVLANYTIYDFEEKVYSVRSYVFRQFYFSDSVRFPIFDKLSFEGMVQIINSESGRMKWREFKERPTIFIDTRELRFKLVHSARENLRFSCGYHLFDERRFKFVDLEKVPDSRITAYGPTCEIEFEGSKFILRFDGWVENLKFGDRINFVPNLNLNLTLKL
jgi:hypothetical protein